MDGLKLRSKLCVSAAIGATLFAAMPAEAAIIVYVSQLIGANENPPVASAGFGSAVVYVDDVANTLRVLVNFTGLNSNTVDAHIHCCAATPLNNAGVAVGLAGFPLGVTAGSYDNTFNMALSTTYNNTFRNNNGGTAASAFAALVSNLNAGRGYVNVHTSSSPGGEVRGNLVALVPEPSTWLSMIFGFGILGAGLRRQSVRTQVSYS